MYKSTQDAIATMWTNAFSFTSFAIDVPELVSQELAMEIELKMPWVQGVTAILISRRNSTGYGNYRLLVS